MALTPTERADIAYKLFKQWKNLPKDQRPTWETHKVNFYKSNRIKEKWNR